MPFDMIGFAVAHSEARNKGLDDRAAARIGAVGSFLGDPVISLVAARSMAGQELAATPPPPRPPVQARDDTGLLATARAARTAAEAAHTAAEAAHAAAREGLAAATETRDAVLSLAAGAYTMDAGKPPVIAAKRERRAAKSA